MNQSKRAQKHERRARQRLQADRKIYRETPVSAAKYRYELWASGEMLARYKTLGPAVLGALWRSKKLKKYVYGHLSAADIDLWSCIAAVTADHTYAKF